MNQVTRIQGGANIGKRSKSSDSVGFAAFLERCESWFNNLLDAKPSTVASPIAAPAGRAALRHRVPSGRRPLELGLSRLA